MTIRRSVACAVAFLVSGCGDPPGPSAEGPVLLAVNGAINPVLDAGGMFVAIGRGFGQEQGNGAVLVTGPAGLEPATIVSWSDDAIAAQLPGTSQTGTLVVVRNAGDTVGSLPVFVPALDPFNPAAMDWKAGPTLPRAFASVGASLHFPGSSSSPGIIAVMPEDVQVTDSSESTYLGFGSLSGGLDRIVGAVQDSVNLSPRRFAAVAGADGTNSRISTDSGAAFQSALYIAGGIDQTGNLLAQVAALGVDPNGQYSYWLPLNSLPEPRAGASAITAFGNLIVAGGFGRDSLARREVFLAVARPKAVLNGWFSGPPLPEGRAFGVLVRQDDMLFYIGGETGLIVPDSTDAASPRLRSSVYAARLSRRSGFFLDTTWTEVGQLTAVRSRHAAFAVNGGILVTGGVYAGAPSPAESEFASVSAGGVLSVFSTVAAPTIADRGGGGLWDMAFATLRDERGVPHPIILGGRVFGIGPSNMIWWQ